MLIKYKLFYTILHTSYDFYCLSECAYNWVKQFMWNKFNPIYFIGQLSPNGLFTVVNETWYCLRRKGQKLNGNDNCHCCSKAALVLVLVILSYCFLRRARKKTNAIKGESSKKSNHILNYQGMRVVLYLHHMSPSSHFQVFMKMMLTYSSVSDVVQVWVV